MRKQYKVFLKTIGLSLLTSSLLFPAACAAFSTNVAAAQIYAEDRLLNYYVFPDSSVRYLTAEDIALYSSADLRIAKNEIYARHGRCFNSTDLQEYFNQMVWYEGVVSPDAFDHGVLNACETANIAFLDKASADGSADSRPSLVPFLSGMSATGYLIFPDSSVRLLTAEDLAPYSSSDLRVAKNEIFARHGRRFESADLQYYFSLMPWYTGTIAPADFNHSVFNEVEKTNIAYLDAYISSGAGDKRASFIPASFLTGAPQETPAQPTAPAPTTAPATEPEVTEELEAIIIDDVGIGRDARRLSGIFYESDSRQPASSYQRLLARYHHKQSITLQPFVLDEDGEIIGNFGLQKSSGFFEEGELIGFYDDVFYREVLISSEQNQSTGSGVYDSTFTDVYGLEADDELLLTIEVRDEHISGSRVSIEWMITDDAIYASGYDFAKVYDRSGKLLTETDQLSFLIAADDRYVYGMDNQYNLIHADRRTLEHPTVIAEDIYFLYGSTAGDFYLLYCSSDSEYERYYYDPRMAKMHNGSTGFTLTGWHEPAVNGSTAYDVCNDYASEVCSISRCTDLFTDEWEPVLELKGLSGCAITGFDGDYIFLTASLPKEWHFKRTSGKAINQIDIAVNLKDQTVTILGAGWYS